jgi:murein L,D-transpeptidase YafK
MGKKFLMVILWGGILFAGNLHHLEKGNIVESFKRFVEGKSTVEDLFIIKSVGNLVQVESPKYIELYTRGILEEMRGERQKALEYYVRSIEENPDYNPSYFRFNFLIRKVEDPEYYRKKIERIIIRRFKDPPPVIIKNPGNKVVFLVEKMSQYLFIYRGKRLVEIHPVTTGIDWEDKWREGDKRTPEGLYFFTEFIPPHKLPKMYGGVAVVMNYPNPVDRILKKGGGGIWLHGSDTGNL